MATAARKTPKSKMFVVTVTRWINTPGPIPAPTETTYVYAGTRKPSHRQVVNLIAGDRRLYTYHVRVTPAVVL